ncbi:MAG TPA: D-alanine--D-alanine ligase, partial [Patescibacteria group bacterium]|nr:D-alanine--D-alanine ligase [Patescibacteria group bacterium]
MQGLKKKIAVIMGGVGTEHDVSMNSGTQVMEQIDRGLYDAVKVIINKDHTWEVNGMLCSFASAIDELQSLNIDLAFLALHGTGGEDGTIQGVLEYAGIPYTGSDVTASAVAMDKVLAKKLFQAQGILVPQSVVVECHEWQTAVAEVERVCGYPCVVKPLRDGSSVGVVMADDV